MLPCSQMLRLQGRRSHAAGLVLHYATAIFGCRPGCHERTQYNQPVLSSSHQWHVISSCAPCLQGKAAMVMYAQFEKDRDRNDFTLLPELHSILSGMKVSRVGGILRSLSR